MSNVLKYITSSPGEAAWLYPSAILALSWLLDFLVYLQVKKKFSPVRFMTWIVKGFRASQKIHELIKIKLPTSDAFYNAKNRSVKILKLE